MIGVVLAVYGLNAVLESAVIPAIKNGKARAVDCGALGMLALTPTEFAKLRNSPTVRQGRETYEFFQRVMRGAAS